MLSLSPLKGEILSKYFLSDSRPSIELLACTTALLVLCILIGCVDAPVVTVNGKGAKESNPGVDESHLMYLQERSP